MFVCLFFYFSQGKYRERSSVFGSRLKNTLGICNKLTKYNYLHIHGKENESLDFWSALSTTKLAENLGTGTDLSWNWHKLLRSI